MRHALAVILALFAVNGCTSKTPMNTMRPNSVTVIFKDAPEQSSTNRFNSSLSTAPRGNVLFVDTLLRLVYYSPRTVGCDTLTIPATTGYAELLHRNQAIETLPYLLIAGDTVLFTYGDNLRPRIQSLSSDANTRLYNLLWDDIRAVQPIGYSTSAVLSHSKYRMADQVIHHPKKHYPEEFTANCRRYCIDLDSLRPHYEAGLIRLNARIDSLQKAGAIPAQYAAYLQRQIVTKKAEESFSDSLMHYPSAHLDAIALAYKLAPKNSRTPQIFDRIATDTTLLTNVRNTMLHQLMTSIENGDYWRAYPDTLVQRYRDLYQHITGDTTFRFQMIDKENLVVNGYSTDMVLQGLDGKQIAYGEVLARHKGKVIYIDLWASWCGPCCAGMPAAKKLREEYKGRDVVFLYLAVNDGPDPWKAAVKRLQTDYLGENYRVLNADDSQFLREIKNSRIPHLLIYDRTGTLVNLDAPRAEDPEIRKLLDKYLAQK